MDFLYEELTEQIIGVAYDVMNELGIGYLESVYHKSFAIALRQSGLDVQHEVPLNISFRGCDVGTFKADLVVEQKVIIEIKVAEKIIGDHKAQLINYLCASNLLVGLIINFGQAKVQTARVQHPKVISCPANLF